MEAGVRIRPYAKKVLKRLSQIFEIVIFTASHSSYANQVIDMLDPEGDIVAHRLFRESCVLTEGGILVKDLRIIGNRKIENIVIVDNSMYCFGLQLENGVPILPFYDDRKDRELLELEIFLGKIIEVSDVRPFLNSYFCYERFREYADDQI